MYGYWLIVNLFAYFRPTTDNDDEIRIHFPFTCSFRPLFLSDAMTKIIMPDLHSRGSMKWWLVSVCPSVSLSVCHVTRPNSTTERHRKPKTGMMDHGSPSHELKAIDTTAEAAIPRTRGQFVAWSACLAPSLHRYQFILLGEQRHTCVNNLLRVVTCYMERSDRDSNLWPFGCKSDALLTTMPSRHTIITRVTRNYFRGQKVKGQDHQAD